MSKFNRMAIQVNAVFDIHPNIREAATLMTTNC